MKVRSADLAGSWYPGRESDCQRAVEGFSSAGPPCADDTINVVGGIVPHAGWYFSGKIACNVIKCLRHSIEPHVCIIFGRHLRPESDNYIMKQGWWDTPLGEIEIDADLAAKLTEEFRFTVETPSSYEQDNTIELQLPFVKYFFPHIKIVPIGLPPKMISLDIARRAAKISKEMGRTTIILGSTDLTHYGYNYGYTPKGVGEDAVTWVKDENDKRVVDLMLNMDGKGVIEESLANRNACCSGAAGAAIEAAKELGAKRGEKIAYSTSYDIRPDNSFVGYVGIVFYA
ncbi:MAG: AmmeMemoRadiSam system protein B [Thermodesulfobacteriota bacterium]|nr:AmmeMemoRadiSam system protein B [Thermodesulfobacteriota bacterium]